MNIRPSHRHDAQTQHLASRRVTLTSDTNESPQIRIGSHRLLFSVHPSHVALFHLLQQRTCGDPGPPPFLSFENFPFVIFSPLSQKHVGIRGPSDATCGHFSHHFSLCRFAPRQDRIYTAAWVVVVRSPPHAPIIFDYAGRFTSITSEERDEGKLAVD
jgi:hypothetical protein